MLDPRLPRDAPVIVQGMTGRQGQRQAAIMREFGTNIVGGVSPSGRTQEVDGIPIFKSCAEAVEKTGAVASVAFVRPDLAAAAAEEAFEAGVQICVGVTEGIPIHDTLKVARKARMDGKLWVGPSTAGMAIPGAGIKLGILPTVVLQPGPIGLMSKSGTLSYEVGYRMSRRGIGQSVWVGVGGDPVKGVRMGDLAEFYMQDAETAALVIIGEIGGTEEEDFADALRRLNSAKPVVALIAGANAREGVSMGHAGALVHGERGSFASKKRAIEAVGGRVHAKIDDLIDDLTDIARLA